MLLFPSPDRNHVWPLAAGPCLSHLLRLASFRFVLYRIVALFEGFGVWELNKLFNDRWLLNCWLRSPTYNALIISSAGVLSDYRIRLRLRINVMKSVRARRIGSLIRVLYPLDCVVFLQKCFPIFCFFSSILLKLRNTACGLQSVDSSISWQKNFAICSHD